MIPYNYDPCTEAGIYPAAYRRSCRFYGVAVADALPALPRGAEHRTFYAAPRAVLFPLRGSLWEAHEAFPEQTHRDDPLHTHHQYCARGALLFPHSVVRTRAENDTRALPCGIIRARVFVAGR